MTHRQDRFTWWGRINVPFYLPISPILKQASW